MSCAMYGRRLLVALDWTGRGARILDFDIETRPLSFLGNDYTTDEVTAIAAGWADSKRISVWCLGFRCQHPGCGEVHNGVSNEEMLEGFRALYDKADMVTGHFILGFDLPKLNGQYLEFGLEPLHDKMVHDTKVHLKKRNGLSVSQENLALTLGIEAPKVQMDTPKWREANRLSRKGLKLTHTRVRGDVYQHKQMREELLRRRWLKPPQMWKSSGRIEEWQP